MLSAESWAAGDPQTARPDSVSHTTIELSSCPPSDAKYLPSQLQQDQRDAEDTVSEDQGGISHEGDAACKTVCWIIPRP